ncbi:hypothetical protein J4Q44_G00264710 [Coregonus suidteri]|uniref:Uncharacterized protein n=1 Tax=Coregonus suidteri TaxID=861788 RepID=A0AAN8L9L2_9TELE
MEAMGRFSFQVSWRYTLRVVTSDDFVLECQQARQAGAGPGEGGGLRTPLGQEAILGLPPEALRLDFLCSCSV